MNPISNKNDVFRLIRIAMNHGFLTLWGGKYRFTEEVTEGPQCCSMPDKQRDILLQLMSAFPKKRFTARNASEMVGIKYSAMGYYLDNFMQRGVLIVEDAPGNINWYSFSDDVHAIFEARNKAEGEIEFRQLPAVEKQDYNSLKGTAEAG